jgi:hypothetical protein
MWPAVRQYDRVLFCGKAVFEAFRMGPITDRDTRRDLAHLPMLTWRECDEEVPPTVAWMPHTSMIIPWWNDLSNRIAASKFLRDLWVWTSERRLAAA